LIIGDDWFTKSMLINSIARNEKLQTQLNKSAAENDNLFSTILNQLVKQQEMNISGQPTPNSLPPDMLLGSTPFQVHVSNTAYGNSSFNEPLSYRAINTDKINHVLDGKLKGMGAAFVRAGEQYNVNPALLTAIAQHETGNGKSRAAMEKNNIAGMMGRNGLRSYATVEESIMDMARNLSKNYLGQGLTSLADIGAKYAPVGAKNDPTGLNNHWVTGVSRHMKQFA
jgi:hypothetical protein